MPRERVRVPKRDRVRTFGQFENGERGRNGGGRARRSLVDEYVVLFAEKHDLAESVTVDPLRRPF